MKIAGFGVEEWLNKWKSRRRTTSLKAQFRR